MRKYYGAIIGSDNRMQFDINGTLETGIFTVYGEMSDGSKVYERIDKKSDSQYLRSTKHGMQVFTEL